MSDNPEKADQFRPSAAARLLKWGWAGRRKWVFAVTAIALVFCAFGAREVWRAQERYDKFVQTFAEQEAVRANFRDFLRKDPDGGNEHPTSVSSDVPPKPDAIVLIVLDDAGVEDVGYSSLDAITPNIDALAAGGIVLTDCYAASSLCTPSRMGILTGMNPVRFGVNAVFTSRLGQHFDRYGQRSFPTNLPNITQLGKAGYITGQFDKWHVGELTRSRPVALGFDHSAISYSPYTGPGLTLRNGKPVREDIGWRGSANDVLDFIENHGGKRPIFANWWTVVPHTPLHVPPGFDNSCCNFDLETRRGQVLSMMHRFDQEVGRVVDLLKRKGIYENTLLIVTSDNGAAYHSASDVTAHVGRKHSTTEGGIHVPFMAHWPAQIKAGSHSTGFMTLTDLMPTFLTLAGLPVPEGLDGKDISGMLLGRENASRRASFYWQIRGPHEFENKEFASIKDYSYAVRRGCLKAMKPDRVDKTFAFNLCLPPSQAVSWVDFLLRKVNLRKEGLIYDFAAPMQDVAGRDAMIRLLQSERLRFNNYPIPDRLNGKRVALPYDARLDFQQDDFSFHAVLGTEKLTDQPLIILASDGVQKLSVWRNGGKVEFEYTFRGAPKKGDVVERTIRGSAPVRDRMEVSLVIAGMRNYSSHVQIYADGKRIAGARKERESVFAFVPMTAPLVIGNSNLALESVKLFIGAIWPDELAAETQRTQSQPNG